MNKYGKIFVCMVLIILLISTVPLLARGEEGPMNEVYSFKMNQKLDPILASYYGNIDPGTSMLFFSPTTEIIPIILKVAMNTTTKEFEIIPGFETRSIIGNIITANIPITSLNVLTELACVEYIYSSQPGNFNLELSVEEIRATSVWDMRKGGSSLSGNGVIIGIIDSGIDYTHQDFWYDEGGVKKTRILSIWDQTQNGGSPPSGYFFGSEYTSDDINYALTQINPHVYVPEKDIYGHGTHVAGIAAGDGSAWTEDSTRSGVAPGANIMFVKVPYSFTEADAIDGMNYLVSQAKGINKPIVVSMSISSGVLTAHDGTSPWEITIDNLAEEGVIFVTAAGNEANKDRHASGTASITTTSFEIDCEPFSSVISNQIWFEQGNDMLLYLDMPPDPRNSIIKTCGPFRCNDNESYIFWHEYPYWDAVNEDWVVAKNKITVYYTENNPINRDNAILINIEGNMYYPRPSTNEPQPLPLPEPDSPWAPVQKGIWSFRLYHNSGSNPAYESWIQSNPHTIRTCAYTKDCSSQETTIISPATANSAIAVGSYKTRPETIILPGGVTVDIPGVGTKTYFSSIGPTRDNRNKPDLLAPGTIFSAKSSDGTGEWHSNVGEPLPSLALDNIGEDVQGTDDYKRMDGTSMAAPHVSGVVALMLQVNPTFTKEEIMNILIDFTAKNFNPESIWNNEYGWGKLNDCESMLRRPIININDKATTTIMNNCNINLYAPDPGYGGWDSMRLSNSQSMNWVDIGDPNIESPHGNSQSQQQTYVLNPFGSSNYPNNYLGEWHINGNHWTKIHFKYLNILDGDWLTIQGTGGGTIGISGVNFGSVWTPQPIYGDVTIRFTSDSSGTLPGFEIDMIETYIGYPRNSFNMWEINEPGATQMKVHFENINLATGDYVYLYDVNNALISTYSGTSGAIWSPVIPGDTIRIRFVSNNDYYTAWGFKIDQYQYYDAPWSAWQPYSTTANWQLSSGDGLKTVYCQVMDYAGNLAQTSDTITLETTPPVISTQSISESSPYLHVLDSSLYYSDMMESSAQMFTIQGTATSDGGSPLWKATATSAFGDSPSVDFSPADWSFSYNVISADSGNGAITITAYDTVGNTNSITYPYVEDNTGPSMRNVFPPHNMVLADTTPYFTWSGSDPLGLSSNGFRIQISNDADFSSTIYNEVVANNVIECPIILSDSVYYWKVIGTDNVGNSGQSPTYSFVVDTISPTVQITSPSLGTTVNGIINIQGTATDSNILSYKLEKGWGATPSDFELLTSSTSGKTGILYTLDTTEMINYVYTLKLTVEDKACHITSQSITITVSNPNEIKNLALNSVTPEYLSCRFFLNSPQVVTAWIEDSSGGIIKNIHQNVVMGSGLYPSGLIWDWTDAAGIIIGAGDYVIKVDSYAAPLVSLDIHIRDAPIISVSSGYGSTQPTFSWNNPIGYTPMWHICRQNYLDITTTSTSKSISCPDPSQTIEIYGIYENYITRVGSITYTPNLARISGSISAPDSFWSMGHRVCISVTYDANPNEIGWSPVGVTSVQSDIGSYELFVPAGDYRIMAILYTSDFTYGYDLPYGVFMHVDEYNEYEIDFSIIEKPPYSGGSGCPYAYAWNGEEYQIDNNIIGKSEYVDNAAPDVTDYFKFDIEPEILDGAYSIAIGETGNEYSIFDSFELLCVDHNSDTNIIMDTDGIVRTYGSLQPPIGCVDKHGYNQLQNISTAEEFMYNGYAGDWLELNFGLVDSNSVKLVLNTDEKPKPPINPLLETNEAPGPIDILVMDEWGQWQNVTSIYPRDLWYYEMADISSYVCLGSQLKVKLIWESYHKFDYIGLDISEDEAIDIHHVPLMRATDGSLNNMTEYLKYSDGRYIEMAPNQFITLEYQYVEQTKNERDFILISKGYYSTNEDKPIANVLSLPADSFTYEPIYFDARGSEASNGNITGYFYYFGDGTTSGWLSNPITYHQFTDDGVYNITMIVKDDNIPYRIGITTTTVTVFNRNPEAILEIYQDVNISLRITGRKGNSVTVQIYEDDVLIIEETVTRTPDNPNVEMKWISLHKYLNRDYHVVLLYDATHLGANPTWLNFTSGETYVPFFMDFSTKNGCHQIVPVPTSYLDGVTETNPSYWFDPSGSYDLDGGIVSYLWDFGDNTTSEDIMVEHTYSAPGLYTVTLTVTDNDGAIAKETLVVEVYPT